MYKTLSITLLSHRICNHDFSNCCDAFANKPSPAIWKNYRVERTEFTVNATTVMPAKCQPLPRISSDRMTSLTSSSTVADHLILPPTDKYVEGRYHSNTIYRSLPMLNRGKRHTTTSQRTAHTFSTNTEERQLSCITAYNWTPINAIFFICTICTFRLTSVK